MDSQEASSSTNKSKRTTDKIEEGQIEKRLKEDSPTIPELEMIFDLVEKSEDYGLGEIDDDLSFSDFIEYWCSSKILPYSRFRFVGVDGSTFRNEDWVYFVSNYGNQIKCLKLSLQNIYNEHKLTRMLRKLKHLLLTQLPNLEEFGLDFLHSQFKSSIAFQLFTEPGENSKSKTGVQLPHIKVLYLNESSFSTHTGIVTDLLCASVNLQKLEPFYEHFGSYKDIKIFQVLDSLGKLPCVKATQIEPIQLLSKLDQEEISAPLEFKLKTLDLNAEILYKNKAFWLACSTFISNLFESSKDTLNELKIDSLGFLEDLQFPKFSKLVSLNIYKGKAEFNFTVFPPGINPMEMFPVLSSLELGLSWSKAFPNGDNISSIQTMETLKVTGDGMDRDTINQISVMFPNLKKFEISKDRKLVPLKNFPEVGTAIWTHMNKLQYLKLHVLADGQENAFPAFDSCITGFSKSFCKRICHLLVADKLWRNIGSRVKVSTSEMNAEREFPSILDLKDLKHFKLEVLCPFLDNELKMEPDLTRIGPTWISNEYGFELMDNLTFEVKKQVKHFDQDS